jgi:ATP-binding cassette subfamily E protein 1
MIKMLAGILKPDGEDVDIPRLNISYKPQEIAPKF